MSGRNSRRARSAIYARQGRARDTEKITLYSGVYRIENKKTGMIYIGQSRNLSSRIQDHGRLLKAGKHTNKGMQKDFTMGHRFEWDVLEYTYPQNLFACEQAYINHFSDKAFLYNSYRTMSHYALDNQAQLLQGKITIVEREEKPIDTPMIVFSQAFWDHVKTQTLRVMAQLAIVCLIILAVIFIATSL